MLPLFFALFCFVTGKMYIVIKAPFRKRSVFPASPAYRTGWVFGRLLVTFSPTLFFAMIMVSYI